MKMVQLQRSFSGENLGEEITVKRKKYPVEQTVAVLKQAEMRTPMANLSRHAGITEQILLQAEEVAGLESDQVGELKQVLKESNRLKKLVATLSLDKSVHQDVLSKIFPASANQSLETGSSGV